MNEEVKISVRVPRKNILLITQLIEAGLLTKEGKEAGALLTIEGKDATQLVELFIADLLGKAGLKEMREKLNAFHSK